MILSPRRPIGLRAQMAGLALAALGLPLALAMFGAMLMTDWAQEPPLIRFIYASQELRKAVKPDGAGGLVAVRGYEPPPRFHLVVLDRDGTVVMSTLSFLPPGAGLDFAAVAAAARLSGGFAGGGLTDGGGLLGIGRSPSFFAETVEIEGRTLGAYFAWLPPDDLRGGVEANARIARLASLAFLGGMAVLLGVAAAAQLARAVLRLERSAVAIAAGDLESRVRVKGAREIVDLAAAMDSMRSGLREDRDRRARFLAAVSHDLRTPLTSIGGYLEAVEDGLAADPATLERYVSIMREKTRLLEARIAGLIEFARMDTGEWRLGFETLDLGTFLESQARVFAEDAILADRSFSSDLGAAAGFSVQADAALLARALENLVSNALRYSPPGSAVRLVAARERRASPPGDVLVLILDDEGPGIAPEERELVFEPFVRGSAAHRGEGAGLGLYIARSVIEGHGWSLRAQEAPGGGCRFVATIAASAGSPGPQLPSGRV